MEAFDDPVKSPPGPAAPSDAARRWTWPFDLLGTLDVMAFVLLTAIFITSVLYHPMDEGGLIVCMMRAATGIPCPGCGLTRSFCAIAKGEVGRAFHFHLLGPVLFGIAGIYWLRSLASLLNWSEPVARFDRFVTRFHLPLVFLILFLGVWVVTLVRLAMEGHLTRFGW